MCIGICIVHQDMQIRNKNTNMHQNMQKYIKIRKTAPSFAGVNRTNYANMHQNLKNLQSMQICIKYANVKQNKNRTSTIGL